MRTEFVIERGIKLKNKNSAKTGKSKRKYPFPTMKVGDSFQVGEYSAELMTSVGSAARSYVQRTDDVKYKEFATRKVIEKDLIDGDVKAMIRIWRIK